MIPTYWHFQVLYKKPSGIWTNRYVISTFISVRIAKRIWFNSMHHFGNTHIHTHTQCYLPYLNDVERDWSAVKNSSPNNLLVWKKKKILNTQSENTNSVQRYWIQGFVKQVFSTILFIQTGLFKPSGLGKSLLLWTSFLKRVSGSLQAYLFFSTL